MFKNMKISIKILLVIIVMSLGSLMVVFGTSYYFMNSMVEGFEQTNITLGLNSSEIAKESLLSQAQDYLTQLIQKQSQTANDSFQAVNGIVTEASDYTHSLYANKDLFIGHEMPHPDQTEDGVASSKYFLVKGVPETPEIAEEVNILSNCEYMFAPILDHISMVNNIYIGTESGISYRYSRSNLFNPDYNPKSRDWYTAAMAEPDTLVWLPTYLDSYGNTCITAAMTYRDGEGRLAGVVASDVLLTDVIEDVMSLKIGETGSCFVLDSDLAFIAHPDMTNESFDYDIANHFDGNSEDILNDLKNNDNGIIEASFEGDNNYIAYSTMPETGWIFCAKIQTDEVTAPAVKAKEESDALTEVSQKEMQNRIFNIFKVFMIFFAVIGIIVILLSFAVAGTITRPIEELASSVREIGSGNFDHKVNVTSGDEIGQLAKRFNDMQDSLKEYMENITKVTAEKERIGTELNVATQIQADMLPRIFPAFPGRTEFDIYASMDPAKEVGGDFYDFFMVDDDHVALVVADVSGKGVPAALFMVIAKTLIKNRTQLGGGPAAILTDVNNQLCEGNEAQLFVTVWLAIVEISTGKGLAANAGHEHPVLRHKDGTFDFVEYRHSPAVATMEGIRFREHEFQLQPGDTIFQYSDGVTEATNANNELFGNDRLRDALNQVPGAETDELLRIVRDNIDGFVKDAPQFDDITMLTLAYRGKT